MAVSNALGHKDESGTAVSEPLEHQFGSGNAATANLSRQVGFGTAVSGRLGHPGGPQDRPRVQKRTSNNARIDAAEPKINAARALKAPKKAFCLAAPSGYGLGMLFH